MGTLQEKLIILVAPNGERTSGEGASMFRITPKEIAEDAFRCYQAGASFVHVHGRDEKTTFLTADKNVYNQTFRLIREKSEHAHRNNRQYGTFIQSRYKRMDSMLRRAKDDFAVGNRS